MGGEEQLVTIHLGAALDAELRSPNKRKARSTGSSRDFRTVLTKYGLTPKPLFSDSRDPGFEPIWHVTCPASEVAALLRELLVTPGVEGAYSKSEAPPAPS